MHVFEISPNSAQNFLFFIWFMDDIFLFVNQKTIADAILIFGKGFLTGF